MGILRHVNTGNIIYLKPMHIFGRDPHVADSLLTHHTCSRMHCVVRWQAGHWLLIDESKNGCYVNGKKIEKGLCFHLKEKDMITMGQNNAQSWHVENIDLPCPVLINLSETRYIELTSLNILPSEDNPIYQILLKEQEWFVEINNEFESIDEGYKLHFENEQWTFHPNPLLNDTAIQIEADKSLLELIFDVSRDEENITLTLIHENTIYPLGQKVHFYLLLILARHRQNDQTDSPEEKGWVSNDLLLKELGLDINHLNIQIYRIRHSIRQISEYWGHHLIERRRGEVRLQSCLCKINKENKYEENMTIY